MKNINYIEFKKQQCKSNPEIYEITEEQTKDYQIKLYNKGKKPSDPNYVDRWGREIKKKIKLYMKLEIKFQ